MPLIYNGHNNTIIGHKFDPGNEMSLPSILQDAVRRERRLRPLSYEEKKIQADALTAQYAIVETCKECKRPLIAADIPWHYVNHATRIKNRPVTRKGK